MGSADHRVLQRYVPRMASEWDVDAAGRLWREIDSSLCFVDLSGFTSLSERLAKRGRIGAEELTEVLNRVFGNMLGLVYERGGSLLKFGGDALLLHFTGDDHPAQAASAAVEMRAALREAAAIPTSVGRVALRMSVGIHSGSVLLFRVGDLHRELMITGDAATTVALMEASAKPGEILVSAATATALPALATGDACGGGKLLRWRRAPIAPCGVRGRRRVTADDVVACLPAVLRRTLADGHTEPEHRMATVGFLRLQGIERLLLAAGPDGVADALHDLISTVQRTAEAEEVTFLASDVDKDGCKVILTTGVPTTQDDDDGRMLRTLHHIVGGDSPLRLCAGVNRGHVFAGAVGSEHRATFTVMGDTVNVAARLMASAGAREIYASPAVVVRSRTPFTVAPLPPLQVKGKAEPLSAVSVGPQAEESAGTGADPIPADTSVFVGRHQEVALIGRAVERTRIGAGSVIRILGPTGVGKSRLVAEVLGAAGDVTTVWMRGDPTGRATPYRAVRAPLRRLFGLDGVPATDRVGRLVGVVRERAPSLEPLVPLLATVVDVEVADTTETASIERRFRPDRTADALIELLAAMGSPTLAFVADDAQWFDSASSALVDRLGRAAHEHGWLVLVTRRPDAGGCDPTPDDHIDLAELDAAAAAALVASADSAATLLPVEIDAIVQRSGGNPLFLHELVRAAHELGVDQLPESLQDAVNAELDALGGVARRLVRCASVLGNSFPTDILRELVLDEHIELDPATAGALTRFLDGDGRDGLRFRHGSMREVVYEGLTYRRRRELHLRASEIVERVAGDDPESAAEVLSMHTALGQDHDRAWRFARIAADKARSRYANVEAATHYRRALDAARRLDVEPADVIVVWRHLGDVEEQLGSFDRALDAYRRALALADEPVLRADLLWRRATVRMHLGQYRHALADATRGRHLLDGDPDPRAAMWRARLIALQAWLRQAQQRAGAARRLALEAAEAAETAGDRSALARSHLVLDWAHRVLGHADADGLGERALEIYEELGDLDGMAKASNNLGALAYFEGDWERASNWYRRAISACRRSGNEIAAAVTASNLAELLVSRRQFTDARSTLDDAVRILRAARSVDDLFFAELQIGRLLLEEGEHDAAAIHLGRVRDEAAAVGQSGYAFEAAALGACALVGRAQYRLALDVLDDAARAAGEIDVVYRPLAARARAMALNGLGREQDALASATEGLSVARGQELLYDEALLLQTIDEIRGWASAETHQLFERLGIPTAAGGSSA